jgi:preprotein translocase subunit YajC
MKFLFEFINRASISDEVLIQLLPFLRLFLPSVVMGIAWYCLIIKPQKIQRKKRALLEKTLRAGAIITTSQGISGTVLYILDRSLVIEIASGEKIEVLKQVVTDVQN